MQQIEENDFDELINFYLTDLNHPKTHIFKKEERKDEIVYRILNQSFENSKKRKITYNYEGLEIQDSKLKTFYFSHKYSSAMIENFRNEINMNSNEYFIMHDFNSAKQELKENLFKIDYIESVNKIRDIESVAIDKFEFPKNLMQLNRILKNVDNKIDDDLADDMIKAIKGNIFDYITYWDRIFTLLLINSKYKQLQNLITYIQKSINKIKFTPIKRNSYEYRIREIEDIEVTKKSLMDFLYFTLCRVFSLKYNPNVKKITDNIKSNFVTSTKIDFATQISNCLYASMQYNNLMKYPLEDLSNIYTSFNDETSFNLVNPKNGNKGVYRGFCYPRFIKLHECILHTINNRIFSDDSLNDYLEESFVLFQDKNFENSENIYDTYLEIKKLYNKISEIESDEISPNIDLIRLFNEIVEKNIYKHHVKEFCELKCDNNTYCPLTSYDDKQNINVIKIKNSSKDNIKIGLFNTNYDFNDYKSRILKKPNLSAKRFRKITQLMNEAIRKNVELLIIPEMCIPYEWVDEIINISKNHQIAIVFCIEPIEYEYGAENYMMMALPFKYNKKYKECVLMRRSKNHYSTEEIREIEKYEKRIKGLYNTDVNYTMCIWNDIHIAPYCSYEIASVEDRSFFKSCCDIVAVSDFSKNTRHFAQSISRDLYCYCITANSSKNGGSFITQPSQSVDYLVDSKGGEDDSIITYTLNIKKLREQSIKSDKIIESLNYGFKPPKFRKNNVKERYI